MYKSLIRVMEEVPLTQGSASSVCKAKRITSQALPSRPLKGWTNKRKLKRVIIALNII